jgi:predicted dienelactone hydrolase
MLVYYDKIHEKVTVMFLDFLYVIATLIFFLFNVIKRLKPYLKWWVAGIVLFLTLHLVLGQPRWQFVTMYLATLILLIDPILDMTLNRSIFESRPKLKKGLSLSLILLSLLALFSFPMTSFPKASGPYTVGTYSVMIEDDTRIELYGPNQGGTRKINIQLWYPAESTTNLSLAPWIEGGKIVTHSLARDWNLPGFLIGHTALYKSNSYLEAPLKEDLDPLKVVIISHGWSGFKNLHTDLAEELASHGYLAISIDHTYGSVATLIEDEVAFIDGNALPSRSETSDFLEYANRLVTTYGNDVITTINYLESLFENDTMFKNQIDLEHIGVVGHSTGGGGIVSAALRDDRIKALIGLDAWVESLDEIMLTSGLDIPALYYRSEGWEISFNNEALYLLFEQSTQSDLFQIKGSTHYDFSMAYMLSRLTSLIGLTGSINGPDFNALLEETMLSFFGTHLSGDFQETPWEEDILIERVNP